MFAVPSHWLFDGQLCVLLCRLDPMDLGIKRCEVKDLAGGDARLNASILEDVFGGARGAVADALVLNAGVALAACEVAGSPQEGVAMAQVSSHHVHARRLPSGTIINEYYMPSLSGCPHSCRMGCLTHARA